MDCVFCKIARGEIPCKKAYEDEQMLAFYDLDPQAPVHILLIPKEHIESLAVLTPQNAGLAAHLLLVAARLADENHLGDGWRLVTNIGKNGGQSVPHLHFHLLGGRPMAWPPG